MRILIVGSRDWSNAGLLYSTLDEYRLSNPDAVLVHGGARGVDTFASMYWASFSLRTECHKPEWDKWPASFAPLKRNDHMVALGADLCLAFVLQCRKRGCTRRPPGHASHGTQYTITACEDAGITVRKVVDPQ